MGETMSKREEPKEIYLDADRIYDLEDVFTKIDDLAEEYSTGQTVRVAKYKLDKMYEVKLNKVKSIKEF